MTDYYVGIDVHKTEAQVAVLNDEGQIEREVRVDNADLDEIAQQYAGNEAALEAGSNYFTIVDTLEEYLEVTLANPAQADWLDSQIQKNDRKDAKNLARYLRMGEIPESYVPPTEFREYRALARGRKKFVDKRSDFKKKSTRCSIRLGSRTRDRCGAMKGVSSLRNSLWTGRHS